VERHERPTDDDELGGLGALFFEPGRDRTQGALDRRFVE
jgi:hypothetical protein